MGHGVGESKSKGNSALIAGATTSWGLDASRGLGLHLCHAGVEVLEVADAGVGFGAVGFLVGVVPAGGLALRAVLDDDAVSAREDVEVIEVEAVADLGLGDEPAYLASDRRKGSVIEERAGGVAGAV